VLHSRVLDAAGIDDPELRASYLRCRDLHSRHGRTYYLATRLLPTARRPYVWALYGFARHADEIVDDPNPAISPAQRAEHLAQWSRLRLEELRAGASADPIGRAMVDTVHTWDIPVEHVAAFLDSMRADLTVHQYATFDELLGYMYGSAAVIGLQMLPLLGPLSADAAEPAMALGIAFQLTNFIRDVAEDLDRGRLYLPLEDLEKFGVCRTELEHGTFSPAVRDLIHFQIERTRQWYDRARPGIDMLEPAGRECIRAAFVLYAGILDRIERADYNVLRARVAVPRLSRARVASAAYLRARRAWPPASRQPNQSHQVQVHSTSAKPNSRSSTGA
jgi:15-cis-phytoene synthase